MNETREYSVILWLKVVRGSWELVNRLQKLMPFQPHESAEYKGVRDFHWRFGKRKDAERFVDALRDFANAPEVLLFKLTNYDNVRITYKDTVKELS